MDDNSFFSMDRLIEFGLGMGVAQQMINVMNQSMRSMYVPGSMQSMPQNSQGIYYVALDAKAIGPLNDIELSQLISQKKVNKDTLAWVPGMSSWKPIEEIPAILKVIALTPPPLNV